MQLLPPTMDLNTGVRRSYLSVSSWIAASGLGRTDAHEELRPICHAYFLFLGDAIRLYDMDWSLLWDFLHIPPAEGSSQLALFDEALPLYGTFLTGLVLLIVDPRRRWLPR